MRLLKYIIISIIIVLLLGLVCFSYIVPLHQQTGMIDVTKNLCTGQRPVTKKYHVLRGESHGYTLVREHLLAGRFADGCGQQATFKLYL